MSFSLDLKRMLNNVIEYKICPKYLPNNTLNDEFAKDTIHTNPSFYLKYKKQDGTIWEIVYPSY